MTIARMTLAIEGRKFHFKEKDENVANQDFLSLELNLKRKVAI